MTKTSVAINNLRGFVIVMVVAFHSCMAYLSSQPATQPPFGSATWIADPIVDGARWLPLDLFSAFQFLHLMQLLFFLSGLFVWSSLRRKGAAAFLRDRALRLGIPFAIGTCLLMPAAYYSVYRVTAADPGIGAFWQHWIALPFWPNGPMWFLWFLLVLDCCAAGFYQFAPRAIDRLAGRVSAATRDAPGRFFVALVAASAIAYFAAALFFSPWQWTEFGPFALQPGFAPQYLLYFMAGLLVGASGLENSFLKPGAKLTQRLRFWVLGTFASFAVWLMAMALLVKWPSVAPPGTQLAADAAVVLFVAFAAFASLALFLRIGGERHAIPQSLSESSYGIYVFHYFFVLWAQYLLLGVALFALIKAIVVLCAALALSWLASVLVCQIPFGARILKGTGRLRAAQSPSLAGQNQGWLGQAQR